MSCPLDYIPNHLHTNNRPDINYFSIGENLFRRCKEEDKNNPFDSISLVDLSINRRGPNQNLILCDPNDVLYNTNPTNGKGNIINESISCLEIKELNDINEYEKIHTHDELKCKIHLKHDKTPCMYSHCSFKIYYNDIETTYENYNKGLKKNNKLRIWCKNELAKMYIKEEVRLNW